MTGTSFSQTNLMSKVFPLLFPPGDINLDRLFIFSLPVQTVDFVKISNIKAGIITTVGMSIPKVKGNSINQLV